MSKLRLSVSYSDSYEWVIFQVLDEDGKEVATRTYDLHDLPEDNRARCDAYGLNKLLTDRTSEFKDKVLKLKAMDAVWTLLCSGEWAKERAVGAIEVSVFVEALAQLKKMSISDTQASLGQYDKEVRAAILAREDVQLLGREIAHARATRKVPSLDDMIPA